MELNLTIGPVLFDWDKNKLIEFYKEVADMPVDRVYIGEVVCVRKKGFFNTADIESTGKMLEGAGKKVIISTLAVVSNEEELERTRELTRLPFAIEANDMSVFNMVDMRKKEVYAGPHITTYNPEAAVFLGKIGVKGITFPVELSCDSIKHNIENINSFYDDFYTEIFAHGKLPLAFSWRCYTSRAFNLTKSTCRHDCARYPDGMVISSLEGEQVFTVNGTSILSAAPTSLVEFTEDLGRAGVLGLRISPHHRHTKKTVGVFRKKLNGELSGSEAIKELQGIYGQDMDTGKDVEFVNGWYFGKAGKVREQVEAAGNI